MNNLEAVSTDSNYLYYLDNKELHRVEINTKTVEPLNSIKIDNKRFFTRNNYLIYGDSYITLVNLKDNTKESKSLGCEDNRKTYLLGNTIYCIKNEALIGHNISSYVKSTVDTNVETILKVSDSWILYRKKINDKRTYYMYNVYSTSKKQVPIPDYSSHTIELFENNVYYAKDNIIYQFDGTETKEYYQFTPTDVESIHIFRMLLNSRILIEAYRYLPCNCPEGGCICDLYFSHLYVVNTSTNKKQEINRDIYGYQDFGLAEVYYFYE